MRCSRKEHTHDCFIMSWRLSCNCFSFLREGALQSREPTMKRSGHIIATIKCKDYTSLTFHNYQLCGVNSLCDCALHDTFMKFDMKVRLSFKLRGSTLSQVRICRSPPPFPQNCSHFHERCAQCWIECKIIFRFFSFLSYSWLYLQITKTLPTKKNCSEVAKFTGKMRIVLKINF